LLTHTPSPPPSFPPPPPHTHPLTLPPIATQQTPSKLPKGGCPWVCRRAGDDRFVSGFAGSLIRQRSLGRPSWRTACPCCQSTGCDSGNAVFEGAWSMNYVHARSLQTDRPYARPKQTPFSWLWSMNSFVVPPAPPPLCFVGSGGPFRLDCPVRSSGQCRG
jgi:hypothetical protein